MGKKCKIYLDVCCLNGSILFWRIALRLEVWGYTNKTRLRGFQRVRAGGLRLCSRDFQSPGVSSKSGCSRLNRSFDDQTQPRIRLETEAILEIISRCRDGKWELVSSTALESEIAQTPDVARREQVLEALAIAQHQILVTEEISRRARELTNFNIKNFDALHIACAEGNAEIFLTTDNRLLSRALNYNNNLNIIVANPMIWLAEVTTNLVEGGENDPN
ncbi:MAG: PIN domain-containing protein [Nostoc sp.]|uniref:type II toxin-antitoxin system VapC family toxin n=1 Tax=Nostoc sp. TaxID=1180 RepID=UPI002FF00DD6